MMTMILRYKSIHCSCFFFFVLYGISDYVIYVQEIRVSGQIRYMRAGYESAHLRAFSLPEVRWQFTKPKEVPLKRKEIPTAPLLPAIHGDGERGPYNNTTIKLVRYGLKGA